MTATSIIRANLEEPVPTFVMGLRKDRDTKDRDPIYFLLNMDANGGVWLVDGDNPLNTTVCTMDDAQLMRNRMDAQLSIDPRVRAAIEETLGLEKGCAVTILRLESAVIEPTDPPEKRALHRLIREKGLSMADLALLYAGVDAGWLEDVLDLGHANGDELPDTYSPGYTSPLAHEGTEIG